MSDGSLTIKDSKHTYHVVPKTEDKKPDPIQKISVSFKWIVALGTNTIYCYETRIDQEPILIGIFDVPKCKNIWMFDNNIIRCIFITENYEMFCLYIDQYNSGKMKLIKMNNHRSIKNIVQNTTDIEVIDRNICVITNGSCYVCELEIFRHIDVTRFIPVLFPKTKSKIKPKIIQISRQLGDMYILRSNGQCWMLKNPNRGPNYFYLIARHIKSIHSIVGMTGMLLTSKNGNIYHYNDTSKEKYLCPFLEDTDICYHMISHKKQFSFVVMTDGSVWSEKSVSYDRPSIVKQIDYFIDNPIMI